MALRSLLKFIFPAICRVCNKPIKEGSKTIHACVECLDKIIYLQEPLCPLCGNPFISEASLIVSPLHICGDCRLRKPYFNRARSAGPYEGVLASLIKLFKYEGRVKLDRFLSDLIIDRCLPPQFDIIVPVPLHSKRLKERGFNQSLLLAHQISKKLSLPVIADDLQRMKWTRPQVELDWKERAANVKGAFALTGNEEVKRKEILLVDDVYTTGSTVNECARVLKKAGAKKVYVATVARMLSFELSGKETAD